MSAYGEDIYISQSGAGTGVSCADSRSAAWFNTAANWGGGAGEIDPGDTAHLCGTLTTPITFQASGTAGNPITVLFESGAKFSAATWGGNIVIGGTGSMSYVIVDGGSSGIIESTDNGSSPTYTYQNDDKGVSLITCSNCIVRNLTVRNLYVKNTADSQGGGGGILMRGSNNEIYSNTVHDTQAGIGHNYTTGITETNVAIYNNTVYRTNHAIVSGDVGAGAIFDGFRIYGNTIYDAANWDDLVANQFHHNGIFVFVTGATSEVRNLMIYNNYIYGDFGARETGHIFVSGNAGSSYDGALIFNNVLVENSGVNGPTNGFIITRTNGGTPTTLIYNNTMHFTTNIGARCMMNQGASVTIKNNVLSACGMGVYNDTGSIADSDSNVFHANTYAVGFNSLAEWKASSGEDTNSVTSDPLLTASYALGAGSPAIGAGANLSSLGITALNSDKNGVARGSSWDIGAYEYAPPPPPTKFRGVMRQGQIK